MCGGGIEGRNKVIYNIDRRGPISLPDALKKINRNHRTSLVRDFPYNVHVLSCRENPEKPTKLATRYVKVGPNSWKKETRPQMMFPWIFK